MTAKKTSSYKEEINTGFGSKARNEGVRLLNKDGSFNIHKKGLSFFERFSFFHWLINMSWGSFFLFMLIGYIGVNTLFSFFYILLGIEGISGITPGNFSENFTASFFFSAQTLTTVGYGAMSPTGTTIAIVSALESFIGLLSFAMATGLLYGRFSKPKAKLLFSQFALIAPYKDHKGLMIRVANQRDSQLINMKAKVMFSRIETIDGEPKRKFYTLPLEIDSINLLATSWTIVHPINEESPLYQTTAAELQKGNIEIMLFLEGHDETYAQEVHSRSSYKASEVRIDKKFRKILGQNANGKATVRLNELSDFEEL